MSASIPDVQTFTTGSGGADTLVVTPRILICAWCDKEQGVVRSLASGVSHGICARHLAAMKREIFQGAAKEVER